MYTHWRSSRHIIISTTTATATTTTTSTSKLTSAAAGRRQTHRQWQCSSKHFAPPPCMGKDQFGSILSDNMAVPHTIRRRNANILLVEKILHHSGCPKSWLYTSINTFWGIPSGAGFFPSTVFCIVSEYVCLYMPAMARFSDVQIVWENKPRYMDCITMGSNM